MDSTQLRVGNEPVMMVDRRLIAASLGVTQRWHAPERHDQPLIVADRPWEKGLYFTYSNYHVFKDPDDGLIKCWYEDLNDLKPGGGHPVDTRLLYAVSEDGLHFDKPELDVATIDGRRTNIVMGFADGEKASAANPWAEVGVHSNGIVIDPHPPTPDERFRTVYSRSTRQPNGGPKHESECAYSPDGIHWKLYDERPQIGTSGKDLGDVSCVFYDHDARLFVQNTRHRGMIDAAHPFPAPHGVGWGHPAYPFQPELECRRRVFQTHSHDFIHWSEPLLVSAQDSSIDNLDQFHYGMGQFRVGRHHFATLGIFDHVDNRMHVRLIHGYDGIHFQPTNNAQPWLAPRGEGYWDTHMVSVTSPPIRFGDRWHFYHGGTSSHHDWWMSPGANIDAPEYKDPANHVKFGLGLATTRVYGFASIDARWPRAGWFQTRPLHTTGKKLYINARCRPGGKIRAEILDPQNNVIEGTQVDACDAFTGDSVEHEMTWSGQSEVAKTGWHAVRFYLRDAEVFSLRFGDEPE